jgi:hypothetical protein
MKSKVNWKKRVQQWDQDAERVGEVSVSVGFLTWSDYMEMLISVSWYSWKNLVKIWEHKLLLTERNSEAVKRFCLRHLWRVRGLRIAPPQRGTNKYPEHAASTWTNHTDLSKSCQPVKSCREILKGISKPTVYTKDGLRKGKWLFFQAQENCFGASSLYPSSVCYYFGEYTTSKDVVLIISEFWPFMCYLLL